MTVLLHDAVASLGVGARTAYTDGLMSDILYADDTLLIAVRADWLEQFTSSIVTIGKEYGLELHWGKVQLVCVRGQASIRNANGEPTAQVDSMTYLGCVVHEDGRAVLELSRRIGMCSRLFKNLQRVWAHSAMSLPRKLEIFKAVVLSKLQYGLVAMWLTATDRRKLDGFQCYCLRVILRIPPAFISRISHDRVLARAGQERFSHSLLRAQLVYFGKVARAPEESILRQVTFQRQSLRPLTEVFIRKVGRPRQTWAEQLLNIATQICGSRQELETIVRSPKAWNTLVRQCTVPLR